MLVFMPLARAPTHIIQPRRFHALPSRMNSGAGVSLVDRRWRPAVADSGMNNVDSRGPKKSCTVGLRGQSPFPIGMGQPYR